MLSALPLTISKLPNGSSVPADDRFLTVSPVLTQEFAYELPPELIAQHPAPQRDASRLLVFDRSSGRIQHRRFPDLTEHLRPGDVLVLNDSRVIPARLRAVKPDTQGAVEILLLEEVGPLDWWVLLRPGKRVRPGTRLLFRDPNGQPSPLTATVTDKNDAGWCRLQFAGVIELRPWLASLGEIPLPPYIHRDAPAAHSDDRERYQTVYACSDGSVAAPTAGLHFTPALLTHLESSGVELHRVTLHVGHGTFAPVKARRVEDHVLHEERFVVPATTADAVNRARSAGRRIVAVGTTALRVLESVARENQGRLVPGAGRTRLFLHPPATFQLVDVLLTNFHLPESTLLMLVSALAAPGEHPRGREALRAVYAEAIRERYRFFSYGDAMLLI